MHKPPKSVTHGQCDAGLPLPSQPQGITCTKLYCLVTEAHVCEQLAHGGYLKVVSIKCVAVHKVATPVQELTWHKAI